MAQVRITETAYKTLRELSVSEERPMVELIEEAILDYKNKKFLHGLMHDFDNLRNDPEGWLEYERELAPWESMQNDGLE